MSDVPGPKTHGSIAGAFATQFERWNLRLPEPPGDSGTVEGGGWVVNYRFVRDEHGPSLLFFASHRLTNDTLYRIGPDGRIEVVDECWEMLPVEQLEQGREHNRAFYERVAALGLFEPATALARVNAYLRSGGSPDRI